MVSVQEWQAHLQQRKGMSSRTWDAFEKDEAWRKWQEKKNAEPEKS